MPATMSVFMRSPIIAVVSECASMRLRAERNIIGLGCLRSRSMDPWKRAEVASG